jgi:hypothetical protein
MHSPQVCPRSGHAGDVVHRLRRRVRRHRGRRPPVIVGPWRSSSSWRRQCDGSAVSADGREDSEMRPGRHSAGPRLTRRVSSHVDEENSRPGRVATDGPSFGSLASFAAGVTSQIRTQEAPHVGTGHDRHWQGPRAARSSAGFELSVGAAELEFSVAGSEPRRARYARHRRRLRTRPPRALG